MAYRDLPASAARQPVLKWYDATSEPGWRDGEGETFKIQSGISRWMCHLSV